MDLSNPEWISLKLDFCRMMALEKGRLYLKMVLMRRDLCLQNMVIPCLQYWQIIAVLARIIWIKIQGIHLML